MRRLAWRSLAAALVGQALFGGCSDDSTADKLRAAKLAEGCILNTDCTEPLVCAFRRCHDQCEQSRDCPEGSRCMASDRPFHVCQLASEKACTYNSDCPEGQQCAVDGECRDQCASDRDCVTGQVCASGTCADKRELNDAGALTPVVEAGPQSDGIPCAYSSECPAPFICR